MREDASIRNAAVVARRRSRRRDESDAGGVRRQSEIEAGDGLVLKIDVVRDLVWDAAVERLDRTSVREEV